MCGFPHAWHQPATGRHPMRCVFHQSVQLHGRALLEKGLLLPLCFLTVKWQMTGLISCCRKGTFGPPLLSKGLPQKRSPKQPFRKERHRLQAKHLWMEIKLSWNVLSDGMYTHAPTGMPRERLCEVLFNRAAKSSQRNPYEEKAYRGPDYNEVQGRWKQCQDWMWCHWL